VSAELAEIPPPTQAELTALRGMLSGRPRGVSVAAPPASVAAAPAGE
jgi:hypothetical protein